MRTGPLIDTASITGVASLLSATVTIAVVDLGAEIAIATSRLQ